MTSDDTPNFDRLIADLRARRDLAADRATEAGLGELADLGTVEVTIAELDQLLARLEAYDTEVLTYEFTVGAQTRAARRFVATIEAVKVAAAGQDGPLADTIAGILRDHDH